MKFTTNLIAEAVEAVRSSAGTEFDWNDLPFSEEFYTAYEQLSDAEKAVFEQCAKQAAQENDETPNTPEDLDEYHETLERIFRRFL